jgi:alpha,alpha-trehalase
MLAVLGVLLPWGLASAARGRPAVRSRGLFRGRDTIARASKDELRALRRYIQQGWHTLSRDPLDLTQAAQDPKIRAGGKLILYVPPAEDPQRIAAQVRRRLPPADRDRVEVRVLPADGNVIEEHGLLYLPHRYVVPGGRFNELFGWDSYFIQRGLLRSRHIGLSRGMVDDLLYEVEHYGKVLNANRTYALSRSQPPLLTRMVLEQFAQRPDAEWLAHAYEVSAKYWAYWTSGPRQTPNRLSRYFDEGSGPAPEVEQAGHGEYQRVKDFFRRQGPGDPAAQRSYDPATDELSDSFFRGDRAMRASGFDTTNRFGPFGADTISYNPVCLNSLLVQMETDMADMADQLGRPGEAAGWRHHAELRRQRMQRFFDRGKGLFFDWHLQDGRSPYAFASTFFPLWTGVASQAQADSVAGQLHLFERPGGILTSLKVTGHQWDAPFGWAPLVQIAVEGLRRYGHHEAANRVAVNFLSMVLAEFRRTGKIVEKYDVERRSSRVRGILRYGYTTNEVGFGWTNGAFLELYHQLPRSYRKRVLQLDGMPIPGR